jgi:tetratricopeptide (TPR) repeat protein
MHPRERGRGGMGAVDEARDPRLARPVALRMLGVEGERPDQPSVARFLREARAAANPRYARSWNNRASLKADRDDAAGALADDSRALELDPNSAVAWNNRGYTKAEAGDVAGALADYDEALRLHPGYALAYLNRGSARLGTGDSAGSAADFPRAVDLLPQGAPRRAVAEEALRQARGPAIPS